MSEKQFRKLNTWVKVPTVFQMEATECGAASLAMVLSYYGCEVPLEKLRTKCGVGRDGSNTKGIKTAAEAYGLSAKGYLKSFDGLLKIKTPAILFWNNRHFVVFEGCRHGYFYINDPAQGRRRLSRSEAQSSFSNVVLTFEKTEQFVESRHKSRFSEQVAGRIANNRNAVLWLFCSGILLIAPGLLMPVLSSVFLDRILYAKDTGWLSAVVLAMAATLLFQIAFTYLRNKVLIKLQVKLKLLSAYTLLDRLFKLQITFFEQRSTGDLMKRVENNDAVNEFLAGELAECVLDSFTAVVFLAAMLVFSPLLTAIGVVSIALNIGIFCILSERLKNLSMKAQQDEGMLYGKAYATLTSIDTVKATGAEDSLVAEMLGSNTRFLKSFQKISRTGDVLDSVPTAVSNVFNIIVIMVGGILVIRGNGTIGMLVAFSQLLSQTAAPTNRILGFYGRIQTLKADIIRVSDVEKYPVATQFSHEKADVGVRIDGNVEFQNVTFGYNHNAKPLIEDFCFRLEAGKSIALVGGSGSGKTTVGKLACGLLDAWSGEIRYCGHPIHSIPNEKLYSNISTVNQSISLFAGTIRENLTLWNEFANEERLLSAAKDACIHDDIVALPDAYNAIVKENGVNFSGGQRQRLEIARALVCNPAVLVLDEATSALDPIVEKRIIDNIRRRGCSCIIIAHRLSTIRDCDEILVMDRGKIVQRGVHEDLMNEDGPYRELIRME